jgi:hypothetical protein
MSPVDAEDLIAHLSGGLAPADRTSFRRAAENALATEPQCWGEDSVHRTVARLWRSYFHPPTDTGDAGWYAKHQRPASKLLSESPPPRPQPSRSAWRGG